MCLARWYFVYSVTLPLALEPSEKFTVTVYVDPAVKSPLGKFPFTRFDANIFKLAPAVSGKFTVPLAAFSSAVSSPLAAPKTQNISFGVVSHTPTAPLRVSVIPVSAGTGS